MKREWIFKFWRFFFLLFCFVESGALCFIARTVDRSVSQSGGWPCSLIRTHYSHRKWKIATMVKPWGIYVHIVHCTVYTHMRVQSWHCCYIGILIVIGGGDDDHDWRWWWFVCTFHMWTFELVRVCVCVRCGLYTYVYISILQQFW